MYSKLLFLTSSSSNVWLRGNEGGILTADGSEYMIRATANSSVKLYHDNTKKFETTADGVKVTTDIQIEGGSGDTELKLKRTNTAGSNGNAFGSIKFIDENNNESKRARYKNINAQKTGQTTKRLCRFIRRVS